MKIRDDILNPLDLSHISYVVRGKQDEEKGVSYLLDTLKGQGFEARAYPIGLVIHPEYERLAASPDRLLKVGEDWCLVEVKNWYVTDRQKGIRDLRYLDKEGRLRHTHSHYYQIQTALLVSGMKSCYFVVHGEQSRIEMIEFDLEFSLKLVEKAKLFYETMLKPMGS